MIKAEEISEIIKKQLQGYEAEVDLKEAGDLTHSTHRCGVDESYLSLVGKGRNEPNEVRVDPGEGGSTKPERVEPPHPSRLIR